MDNQTIRTAEVFGRNLCIQRKNKNLTQSQLSKELGIHDSTLSNLERGTREPSLYMLIALSKYFNLSIDYLLGNKVTIPEHYVIVNDSFPGLTEYLYKASMNINIEKRDKIERLIKLLVEI